MKLGPTGLAAWLVQRAGAVYMLLFMLYLLGSFWLHPVHSLPQWRAWVANPAMSLAVLVFFTALLGHMWVGLRDVLLDYVQPAALQRFSLGLVAAALFGIAAWVLWILVRPQT